MRKQTYMTTQAAASEIGIDVSGVRRYCRLGSLPAKKHGRDFVIMLADLEHFKLVKRKYERSQDSENAP